MGNAKPSLSDVVNKLLGPVIFSLVLLVLWPSALFFPRPLPDAEKIQETVVRELRTAERGDTVMKPEKWDSLVIYSYDKKNDKLFIDAHNFCSITLDRRNRTVEITNGDDYLFNRLERLWGQACCNYFIAAVVLAVLAFGSSRDWGRYVSLSCGAIIAAMYLYTACAQYRMCGADNEAVAPGRWSEVREMLRAAPETGFATIHGVRCFIGKKRNFGIDFVHFPAGKNHYVYVLDGASEQQLQECTKLRLWEKIDDGVYRYACGILNLLRATHAIFAGVFALLLAGCVGTLARKIMRRRSRVPEKIA